MTSLDFEIIAWQLTASNMPTWVLLNGIPSESTNSPVYGPDFHVDSERLEFSAAEIQDELLPLARELCAKRSSSAEANVTNLDASGDTIHTYGIGRIGLKLNGKITLKCVRNKVGGFRLLANKS